MLTKLVRVYEAETFVDCTEELFVWCMSGGVKVSAGGQEVRLCESETITLEDVDGFRLEPIKREASSPSVVMVVMTPPYAEFS